MTREQIKSLINRKIFGQGNQVDLGTALPNILNGIMESSASTQEVDDFEEFSPETSYAEGDIVRKDGKLYKFTTDHDGEWSEDDVEQTNVMEIIGGGSPFKSILEVGFYDKIGDIAIAGCSFISLVDADGIALASIIPITTYDEVLYQFQENWRIGYFGDLNITDDTTWENLLSYLDEHSSPIVTENDIPKPFTLLATPTPDMTTIEQLATTGLTKEVIADMAQGKYSGIIDLSEGRSFYCIQDVYANENDDVYWVDYGFYLPAQFGYFIRATIMANSAEVFIEEV